jgi:hypothetical protein
VTHPRRITRVGKAACQSLGNPEPTFDLRQHQDAGIGRQAAAIEGDVHRLAGDR